MFQFDVTYKDTLKGPEQEYKDVKFEVAPVAGDWVELPDGGYGKVVRRCLSCTHRDVTKKSWLQVHGNARIPKF